MAIKQSLINKRLSRTHRVGKLLAYLPFIRCVILNGSLAQGKSKKSSDIDILIIAKTGRIFTARFFVNAFASVFGIKRLKDDSKDHSGKFCFNYFLTEDFLTIPIGRGEKIDRYCADNYSHSQFVAGGMDLFNKFILVNQDLFNKYGFEVSSIKYQVSSKLPASMINLELTSPSCHPRLDRGSRKIETGFRISSLQSGMTKGGVGMTQKWGNWLEKTFKKYQIKKIESDPRTKKYPNLIVYNDKELRFHPPKVS